MYLWAVEWHTQTIRKEVRGQAKEVEVLGGQAEFCTLASAREHAHKLRAFWPGLALRIAPAIPAQSPVRTKAGPGLAGVSKPKRFRKPPAELAVAEM